MFYDQEEGNFDRLVLKNDGNEGVVVGVRYDFYQTKNISCIDLV